MLNDQQYQRVYDEVRSAVSQQLLVNELIDHLCCGIEQKMEQGGSFEQAFQEAMNDLCDTNLKEIEIQTIYLLTLSNSYPMKKFTYLSGFLATTSILTGFIFKVLHWKGADWIIVFGHLFLLTTMLLLLIFNGKTASLKTKLLRLLAIMSGILISIGGIFKIFHWPSANIQMIAGMFLLITIVVPAYFWKLYKESLIAS